MYLTGYTGELAAPFVWASTDSGATWTGIMNLTPTTGNAVDGWSEWDLNTGFGGRATGICVDPSSTQNALFVNASSTFSTTGNGISAGTTPSQGAVKWAQRYTQPATNDTPGPGIAWSGTGLELTTAWDYLVAEGNHFVSYTDRGLAASFDGGVSWVDVHAQLAWPNCYQVLSKPGTQRLWAAVAKQHDLPVSGAAGSGDGAVLRSDDAGKTWTRTALPVTLPVTSIAYGTPAGSTTPMLYAAVYGDGVSAQSGVWQSADEGDSWTQINGAIANTQAAYRLALDGGGRLYCVVANVATDPQGGKYVSNGTIHRRDSTSASFAELASIQQARSMLGSAQNFWPMDLTTHGQFVYIGTYSSGGSPAKALQFDGDATWANLQVPFNTTYALYPHVFGVYFVGNTAFVTSDGNGTYSVPISALEPSVASPSWSEVTGLPFLRTLRVFSPDAASLYVTTFGNGVWRLPQT